MPTAEEQAELSKRKIITGQAPAWFSGRSGANVGSSGIIPNQLAPAPAIASRAEEVAYPTLVRADEIKDAAATTGIEQSASSLQRINTLCPGVEKETNAALTEVDRAKRIEQYQALAQKCPMSADVQLWLAGDYLKANRALDARTTYEHVLVLDPTNEEARAGIINAERQMK